MPLVGDDDVVETLAPDRPNDAFDVRILPRRAWCGADGRQADRVDRPTECGIEGRVAVVDEEARLGVVGAGLAQLLAGPCGRGMPGHVNMQDPAPVVSEDDEDEEDAAGERRHREEVDRDGRAEVILEEGAPALRERRSPGGISRETVRSESANPSFNNSPWIRGAPQSGFATAISRARRRISAPACGRPPRGRERRVQYHAKPRRCQATTVAGRTTTKADFHPSTRHAARSRTADLTNAGWLRLATPIGSQLLPERQVLESQTAVSAGENEQ
jgi:hypothetical protein